MYRSIRVYVRFFSYLSLILFLLQITSMSPVIAQTEPVPSGDGVLPDGTPARMAYQPPANADSFNDFVPPRALVIRKNVVAQEVATFDRESLSEARAAFQPQNIPLHLRSDVAVPLANNRLNIIVEKNTFEVLASLEVRSISALSANEAGRVAFANMPFMRFELEMLNDQQQPIPAFSKNVRLVVDLREYGIDLDQDGGYFYLAYEDENEPGKWLEVPITYHGQNGLISAEVAHFSDWQAGWRPEAWTLEWRPPSVNEFTGAASYQYPIQVPPGRNGLQPSVGLSYSSASLRGAIQKVSYGNVATGWSLNDISITRTGIKNGVYSWTYPDKFRLTINGVGGRLIEVGTEDGATIYRVEDYPQFKVYNYGGRTWDANQSGNSYWVVRSGDGIHYRLGYITDSVSEQGTHPLNQPYEYEIIAWHVDTITDSYGNQITYDYFKPSRLEDWGFWGPVGNASWSVDTQNSQVTEIAYNFTTRVQTLPPAHDVPRLASSPASRILFKYENGESRLTAIEVQHGNVTYPSRRYEIKATTVSNENPSVCDEFDLAYNSWQTLYSSTRVINYINLFYGRR